MAAPSPSTCTVYHQSPRPVPSLTHVFDPPAPTQRPEVIASDQPGALMLVTSSGSHVGFNEGRLGRGSYHMRISLDFLEAARATATGQSK